MLFRSAGVRERIARQHPGVVRNTSRRRQRLFPAVQAADSTVEIVADGISCRQQIEHATGRQARHMIEVLWEAVVPQQREDAGMR